MIYEELIEKLRRVDGEFNHLGAQTFLDHAANGVYMSSLIKDFYQKCTQFDEKSHSFFSNPHSHSQSAAYTKLFIDLTRQKLLRLFNTNQSQYDVVFTQNATYALKLLAECFKFNRAVDKNEIEDITKNNKERPVFAYLNDNHTSVIGMREVISNTSNSQIVCLTENVINSDKFNAILVDRENERSSKEQTNKNSTLNNNLFIYPAQSNFNGRKYSLDLIEKFHEKKVDLNVRISGDWFVCVDTASFLSTSELDLTQHKPDFLVASFYKIFGFPTGLGALLIRKSESIKLSLTNKKYFGGGTIQMCSVEESRVCFKNFDPTNESLQNFDFHEFLEDGTVSYLEIIALNLAIEKFDNLTFSLGFKVIREHTENLSEYFSNEMNNLKHYNRVSLVEIYRCRDETVKHGPIFAFNLKTAQNEYIGYSLVDKLAQESSIHLRMGCFCNVGACQMYLPHVRDERYFRVYGRKCGDDIDLINGRPTGAIRVSFGYSSIQTDIRKFVDFLKEHFLEVEPTGTFKKRKSTLNDGREKTIFKIKKILIYPVKSCAPMIVQGSWPIQPKFGFLHDRRWLITDPHGLPFTQKRLPLLKNIKPHIDLSLNSFKLNFGQKEFKLDLVNREANLGLADEGDAVAEWLSDCLNQKCRLFRSNESENKSFSNKTEFLLINQGSVKKIRQVLIDSNKVDFNEEEIQVLDDFLCMQFRANLVAEVLSGEDDCFDEERWEKVKIIQRGVEFEVAESCTRCHMINIDQRQSSDRLVGIDENFGKFCSALLKQIYKIKANSKFGIYLKVLGKNESGVEMEPLDFYSNDEIKKILYEKKFNELSTGDVGIAFSSIF